MVTAGYERHLFAAPVATSVLIALAAASAAYWLVIRVLEWKPRADNLRVAAALVMVGG
jgi:NO-binding membrane sensor protein with MHYT domain